MPESAAIPAQATVLGFDAGSRRIGVAVGSAYGAGARALAMIDVHGHGPDWPAIDRLVKEWRPQGLLVGDPMTLDGGDQPIRAFAKGFAQALQSRYALPVAMIDERTSSLEAAQRFAQARAQGGKRRRDAQALDAIAAAVIVDRWLHAPQDAVALEAAAAVER